MEIMNYIKSKGPNRSSQKNTIWSLEMKSANLVL